MVARPGSIHPQHRRERGRKSREAVANTGASCLSLTQLFSVEPSGTLRSLPIGYVIQDVETRRSEERRVGKECRL